jgi:hypothetical protein
MADQSVRITNLDNSEARVAFDLWRNLNGELERKQGVDRVEQLLQLYAACRHVAVGGKPDVGRLR